MIIWKYGIRSDWMSINPNKRVGGQGGMIQHWPRPFPWKLPSQKMPRNLFNLQSNMTKETKQCCCIKLWRLFVLKRVGAWSILQVEQLLTVLRSGSKSSINMFARITPYICTNGVVFWIALPWIGLQIPIISSVSMVFLVFINGSVVGAERPQS